MVISGPAVRYAWRRSNDEQGPTSPTTVSKWARASSYESAMPSACISGLFGIQTMPPDMHVDPPIWACFSRTSTSAPASAAASAATMPPPPDPAITKSTVVSHVAPSPAPMSGPLTTQRCCQSVDRYYDVKVNLESTNRGGTVA